MRRKRALSITDIENYQPRVLEFEGAWYDAIGNPELTGSWIIWGNSANGKTRLALQLAKYLAHHKKVIYNSVEEGLSLSMQKAIADTGMHDVKRNFLLLDKEPICDLKVRLRKQRSADIVIIDSLQYTGLNYDTYKNLRDEFRNKMFIFISHAEGKEPKGQVAKSVRYDAFVKIYVEGYKAMPQSRYGGGKEYIVWQKGYNEFYGL